MLINNSRLASTHISRFKFRAKKIYHALSNNQLYTIALKKGNLFKIQFIAPLCRFWFATKKPSKYGKGLNISFDFWVNMGQLWWTWSWYGNSPLLLWRQKWWFFQNFKSFCTQIVSKGASSQVISSKIFWKLIDFKKRKPSNMFLNQRWFYPYINSTKIVRNFHLNLKLLESEMQLKTLNVVLWNDLYSFFWEGLYK